ARVESLLVLAVATLVVGDPVAGHGDRVRPVVAAVHRACHRTEQGQARGLRQRLDLGVAEQGGVGGAAGDIGAVVDIHGGGALQPALAVPAPACGGLGVLLLHRIGDAQYCVHHVPPVAVVGLVG